MDRRAAVRSKALIDALEAADQTPHQGRVWRLAPDGADPLRCASPGGRWDNGEFPVLYTSAERGGAVAEIYFHLSQGLPVMPSRARFRIFELSVSLTRMLKLPALENLAELGVDTGLFGRRTYHEKAREYPRTQDIAEAAHFLGCDGLQTPSARYDGLNITVFCDMVDGESLKVVKDCGLADWAAWRKAHSA